MSVPVNQPSVVADASRRSRRGRVPILAAAVVLVGAFALIGCANSDPGTASLPINPPTIAPATSGSVTPAATTTPELPTTSAAPPSTLVITAPPQTVTVTTATPTTVVLPPSISVVTTPKSSTAESSTPESTSSRPTTSKPTTSRPTTSTPTSASPTSPDVSPNSDITKPNTAYGSIIFKSPSGNIGCDLAPGDTVRCDIAEYTFDLPPDMEPCGDVGDRGHSIMVEPGYNGYFPCVSDTVLANDSPVLPYGATATLGNIVCLSQQNGITCTDWSSTHGFRISKGSYELY